MGRRPLPPDHLGRTSRAARLAGLAVVGVIAAVAGTFFVVPWTVRGFVRALQLAVSGAVWVAASISTGADAWTISTTIVRALAGTLASTQALVVILGLIAVSGAALFGLQRLLGGEQESSR